MLKLCDNYATVYNVIFNSKKTVCIKVGKEVIRNEAAFLNNQPLKWNEKVRHLGNIIDKNCTELADCVFKKSMFIGYVNKLRSNFRHLQTHVLITLFKAFPYTCWPYTCLASIQFYRGGLSTLPYTSQPVI